jgi:hypothetical protein
MQTTQIRSAWRPLPAFVLAFAAWPQFVSAQAPIVNPPPTTTPFPAAVASDPGASPTAMPTETWFEGGQFGDPAMAPAYMPCDAAGGCCPSASGSEYGEWSPTCGDDPRNAHSGLLGKTYIDLRYEQVWIDDPLLEQFDDTVQGYVTSLNIPLIGAGGTTPIGVDTFFGFRQSFLDGSVTIPPPIGVTIGLDAQVQSVQAGFSIYGQRSEDVRPFIQLGLGYDNFVTKVSVGPIQLRDSDDELRALVNLGVEFDITSYLAGRVRMDVETKDQFDDSTVGTELILWPADPFFVRSGVFVPLRGDAVGIQIGGGFAF